VVAVQERLRLAKLAGMVLAGLGGALIVLGLLNGGSGSLFIVGGVFIVVGWGLRLWVKSVEERDLRREI